MLSSTDWIGQTGQLLIGRAYAELGFDDRMAEVYTQMLDHGVTDPIETELRFSMANYHYTHGNTDSAKQRWNQLASAPSSRWSNRARLRLAETSLDEGQPKLCIENCEMIKSMDGVIRTDVLKLMGRAYEQLGENALAAKCYAGQYP